MNRNWLTHGISLAVLGLAACNRGDKAPTQPGIQAGTGSARVELPAMPPGFLADSSQKALFALDIVGPDRDTLRRSAYILPGEPSHPLIVAGVPAGVNIFYGRLYRVDSSGRKAELTHVGQDSAEINPGREAQVRLFLRQYAGSAKVCVQVEGWPSDSTCLPPPPPKPPAVASIFGCWSLQVAKAGAKPGEDPTLQGHLIIVQRDSMYSAELTWASGRVDTASALYRPGLPLAYFGEGGHGGFRFKAHLDSANEMYGPFVDTALHIDAQARAVRSVCATDTGANKRCLDFKQFQDDGKIVYGRLGIEMRGNVAYFYTHLQGYGSRLGIGTVIGNPDSSAALEWVSPALPGVFAKDMRVDSTAYQVQTSGMESRGTVRNANPAGKSLGTWSGMSTLCISHDFRL